MTRDDSSTREQRARLLETYFVGRRDIYAVQNEKGEYTAVRQPLSLELLLAHCNGQKTIATYPANDIGNTPFAIIDIDRKDTPAEELALFVKRWLAHFRVPAFIEFSGRKGYHTWAVFKCWVPATKAARLLNIAVEQHKEEEGNLPFKLEPPFPRQARTTIDRPGNAVKLPWGVHRVTGNYAYFVADDFLPLDDWGVQAISQAPRVTEADLDAILAGFPEPEAKIPRPKPKEKTPDFSAIALSKLLECCTFMQHCRDEAATLSEPRWWSMVCILSFFGEPGREKAHELSKPYPQYTEAEANQKLEYAQKAANKEVGPHTCLFVEQKLGFGCPESCLAKKLGTKSPAGLASKVATRAGFRNTGLPVIVVNNRQLRDITKDALTALYEANELNPKIFTRGGNLVRVSIDEKQNPYIDPLTESALRGLLTRAADFVKVNINAKGEVGETEVSPPLDVVCDTLSLREWQLPPLLSITEVPVIRSDGTIVKKIGYDATTCLYYHPAPELRVPPVPDTPTKNDVKAAKDLILEVICNFPFDSEASGGNAVAAMLTPIVRPMIDGLVPLAVFDKPQPGTGASLLADVVALISTGQTAGMLGGQRKEEEWRKAITAVLLHGRSVIVIDNVDGFLYSTSLATVLTARVWRDRILGRNEEVLLPNLSIWIANGNNIRLLGDLPRRAYRVRLDAQLAQPWLRRSSEFKHPDLIKWVKEKRGDIIAAMLTVARSWVVAGKPAPQDLITIGSFENFCEVLEGILSFMGVKGFLQNLQQMYTEMDVETPQWENFLEAWQEIFGDSGVTVAEVARHLNENDGFAATLPDSLADKDEKGHSRKLGNALARRTDVRFPNGLTIQKGALKQRAIAWKVTRADIKLTSFSFGSELSELASKPRACEDENDNKLTSNRAHPNSPNSLLDTKVSELVKNKRPTKPCHACGPTNWWQRPDGEWVCGRCHPRPAAEGEREDIFF